jgi:hypothetical protein
MEKETMNEEEFKKLIEVKELAQMNDNMQFIAKVNLNILLRGGHLWKYASIGAREILSGFEASVSKYDPVETAKKMLIANMVYAFNKMLRTKTYVVEGTDYYYMDEIGVEHWYDPLEGIPDDAIVTSTKEVHEKETFFLDDSLSIKEIKIDDFDLQSRR